MVTTAVDEQDLIRLEALVLELHAAGRTDQAQSVARAYSVLQGLVYGSDLDEDDDPEFVASMLRAEEDIKAGRLIPHEEVVRRIRALDDAER